MAAVIKLHIITSAFGNVYTYDQVLFDIRIEVYCIVGNFDGVKFHGSASKPFRKKFCNFVFRGEPGNSN